MEYLRSLFGSLQQALDFVSSFTTYLFGNEPHPGAEEAGSEREMKNCRSHHDSEVETTYSGDVSPREQLKVTEDPFTAEITPFSQEIQGTSETAVTGDQAMESFLRSSKFPNRCEGQEESGQKFSVSSVCLSDTPELESTTPMTDIIQQAPLEAPTMTGRLCQRKSEESALVEVAQEDMIEELADAVCSQYCSQLKPDEPLAERRELGQMEEAGETGMSHEAEQDRNVLAEGIEQGAPNWAASVEQKRGPEGARWTGEIVQGSMEERAEIMDNQQLEVEPEQRKVGEKAQGEINTAALNQAEDKVLEEERTVGRSQLWDEEAEKIAEDQEKELENRLWNEGIQQKPLDLTQDREEKQRGQEDATWSRGTQQDRLEEMAKMARDQQLNVEKEQGEDIRLDGNEQVKTSVTAEIERDQVKMLEEKGKDERSWNLEECLGGAEEGKERKLDEKERELEGVTWTNELQYDALNVTIVKTQGLESGEEQGEGIELDADHQIMKEIVTKNEEVQQPLLDKVEMETSQKKALEGEEKERCLYWEPKETEIMIEQKREAPELEKGENCKQGDLPEKGKIEENLKQEVEESVKNEINFTREKQEQQIREEWCENNQEEQPEILVDTCGLSVEMMEVAETTSDQSNQLGETTKILVYPTSLDTDLLAGPRVFPHDVATLDSSAQKERVLLRRKSSIRRAPSLKKPKPSAEVPTEETKMAEDAPALLEVPKRQNPRLSGFGPMHPNMMAELQMRLQKPK
ncbi:golgin subfamily A member 6-like protein 22 [Pantherophis guttatus]|uniref:Apolipoprotein B receptor n=1 Tax=Pantherophis guttatus TaxID=94885 RepID=A0A6P9C9E4_PANGU|nr:golgin subfamily A member 6-like protein 22 [Pantherophis guttatus]XP_034279270.1 golgin subfamily A member 6-like protein 22 [Pantherophis guttatus]XP_034279271.1 golgin subfamily A member 6-like protein 22 [Pantherophis guttatus]XP_034279272.1 golgin subfamily A member 6-like protein 22 [Pantherophis guttatus]XP_034279273.1 golgin subfamily A member 6-like protein 22 [Pantherophis guttatus]XP_034279275.1 golgin subfamily A member 6-like protein 22 [Pantherophis guttatus]XP_060548741.1 go